MCYIFWSCHLKKIVLLTWSNVVQGQNKTCKLLPQCQKQFFKGFLIKKNPSFKDHVPIKKAGSYGNSDDCPHQDIHQQNVLLSLM